ncbi:MAG: hypothetical protein KAG56_05735 [Sulfurovaceae bacterium]|nr:hypothetical protein [Sulfurovaceae bacterium]
MKKIFLFTVIIALTIFSSLGCITKQVWKDREKSNPYSETIVAFYINHPKKEIAFLGEKYHYIFNERTEQFTQLIEQRKFLKLTQKNLQINSSINRTDNRIIRSNITVHLLSSKLTTTQKSWLEAHGFRHNELPLSVYNNPHSNNWQDSKMVNVYSHNYNIRGIRYQVDPKVNERALKLKSPIVLEIHDWKVEKKSNLYKIAMTPLSLTGDAVGGVIMLGAAIVMSPVWLYQAITR